MTQEHPITPPPELVTRWWDDADQDFETVAIRAARWGADMEFEACVEWLQDPDLNVDTYKLRAARRPKPPSLKEQALETLRSMQIEPMILDGINVNKEVMDKYDLIRRALESLPD